MKMRHQQCRRAQADAQRCPRHVWRQVERNIDTFIAAFDARLLARIAATEFTYRFEVPA